MFGYFTGKCWGDTLSQKRILLAHGIQHNCGAFKRLIRLLPINSCMVAIDLPGHGYSSHFPLGLPIDFYNYVFCIKRIVDYLKWDRFIFIGHSFGSQIGTYFTAIFPERVKLLIVIDSMEPRPVPSADTLQHLQTVAQQYFELERKLSNDDVPVYKYDEVFQKTKKNGLWPLSDDATKDILERSIKTFKGGYTFVADQRLKITMRPVLTFEQQVQILDGVKCPVFFILAKGNMERYGTYLKQVYEYNKTRENREIVVVEGDHAVHQNHPERISWLINKRISEYEQDDDVLKIRQT